MTNLTVKYYAIKTVKSVTFASPDVNGGRSMSLPFTTGSDSGGSYVTFTIPSLLYWDMVYMKVE
jgi:dextranase